MSVVALIPAFNEEATIGGVVEALLAQDRVPDRIVVIPNGCADGTADVARQYPVTVMELPRLQHRKAEALNLAWREYAQDADMVVCLDADTILPPNAVGDWERELASSPDVGGSSSKFTMQGTGVLGRLQKAECSAWADLGLRNGYTTVLSGTGSAIRGSVLAALAARDDRDGPWCYTSATEDFELTYRIREMGFQCRVSPTVRAYTDSMRTVRSLWGQRMKWQVGTVEDLMRFGVNRLTLVDWWRQGVGALNLILRILTVVVLLSSWIIWGSLTFHWLWLVLPALYTAVQVKRAMRIPHRDWKDVAIAALIVPNEAFSILRSCWFAKSWWDVVSLKMTGRRKDLWSAQYQAEGMKVAA